MNVTLLFKCGVHIAALDASRNHNSFLISGNLWSLLKFHQLIIFANSFACGILGQVWYLIVFFPDLCRLSYFDPDQGRKKSKTLGMCDKYHFAI